MSDKKQLKTPDLPPDLAEEDARWREEMLAQHGRRAKPMPVKATVEPPRRPRTTAAEQSAFERVAREHGASDDEDAFKGVLRKLAEPKA